MRPRATSSGRRCTPGRGRFLQRPAAEALVRAHRALARHGYGALVYDGYRPWSVTWVFWEATPSNLHQFVADPAQGSRHKRGCAVELGLYELASGAVVAMPSGHDEMTERADSEYPGGTGEERGHRDPLRGADGAVGTRDVPARVVALRLPRLVELPGAERAVRRRPAGVVRKIGGCGTPPEAVPRVVFVGAVVSPIPPSPRAA